MILEKNVQIISFVAGALGIKKKYILMYGGLQIKYDQGSGLIFCPPLDSALHGMKSKLFPSLAFLRKIEAIADPSIITTNRPCHRKEERLSMS